MARTFITSTASGEVDLSWANGSTSSPGFLIERSTDNLTFDPVDQVGPGTTSYADISVADGTTYYYQIVATNDGGDSGPSNVATTPTPLAAPSLTASASSASQIDLTWQDNSQTATGFTVLRSTLPDSGFAPVNTVADPTRPERGRPERRPERGS
ncbi:MAG TPA: hypothetical protein VG269_16440 [Tepidisphaeraceae bacterium]|nr:hypothetical protein [Tepidisphaeraceae bacterium]